MDGLEFWGSLPAGRFSAHWLEKLKELRELGEGPEVLSHYVGPREWDVLPYGCSLTS